MLHLVSRLSSSQASVSLWRGPLIDLFACSINAGSSQQPSTPSTSSSAAWPISNTALSSCRGYAADASTSSGGAVAGEAGASDPAASERVRQLADQIVGLTVLECSVLTELLRKRLNIQKPAFGGGMMAPMMMAAPAAGPAAGAAPAAAAAAAAPEAKKEQTEFDVKLDSFSPEGKIRVIKEVRTLTNLGLKEAKELVEKAPVLIKGAVSKADADNIKKLLEAAGGKVTLS